MKYFFGQITEHYDGYEFSTPVLIKGRRTDIAENKIRKATSRWRDTDDMIFKGSLSKEIQKVEFDVMSNYLYVIK